MYPYIRLMTPAMNFGSSQIDPILAIRSACGVPYCRYSADAFVYRSSMVRLVISGLDAVRGFSQEVLGGWGSIWKAFRSALQHADKSFAA